jgi:hypothetical protein
VDFCILESLVEVGEVHLDAGHVRLRVLLGLPLRVLLDGRELDLENLGLGLGLCFCPFEFLPGARDEMVDRFERLL